jgi:hypothetical protein
MRSCPSLYFQSPTHVYALAADHYGRFGMVRREPTTNLWWLCVCRRQSAPHVKRAHQWMRQVSGHAEVQTSLARLVSKLRAARRSPRFPTSRPSWAPSLSLVRAVSSFHVIFPQDCRPWSKHEKQRATAQPGSSQHHVPPLHSS